MSGYGEPSIQFASRTNVQDPGLISNDDLRVPTGHSATAEVSKDMLQLNPSINTAGLAVQTQGCRIQFKTEKNCDQLERQFLRFVLAPPTVTGGTYKRFVDGVGLHMIDRIEYRNGVQLIMTEYPSYDTYLRMMKETKFENIWKIYPMVGLEFSKAKRNALATANQIITVPIFGWWRDDITKDPIVPAIANGLTIDVYIKPAAQFIETDGTAPQYQFAELPALWQELIFQDEATRARKVSMAVGGNEIVTLYEERITIPSFTVASGSTTTGEVRIDGLNGPMKQLWVLVRPTAKLVDNGYDYCSFAWANNPNTVRIRANQADVVRAIELKPFLQPITDSRFYTGLPFPAILINFSEFPEATNMASGNLNLSQLTNPTIRLDWTSATTQDLQVELVGYIYNWVQHSGGQFRRVFLP